LERATHCEEAQSVRLLFAEPAAKFVTALFALGDDGSHDPRDNIVIGGNTEPDKLTGVGVIRMGREVIP
jgi:hypothetical protein